MRFRAEVTSPPTLAAFAMMVITPSVLANPEVTIRVGCTEHEFWTAAVTSEPGAAV